jgi:hypothetical protein
VAHEGNATTPALDLRVSIADLSDGRFYVRATLRLNTAANRLSAQTC